MANVVGLGHVGIYVRDFERMVAFYRDTPGMRVTKQNWRAEIHQVKPPRACRKVHPNANVRI
jgi:catechol 2,3-dioxygenase-like lactoylglutathione lyase family enzyme